MLYCVAYTIFVLSSKQYEFFLERFSRRLNLSLIASNIERKRGRCKEKSNNNFAKFFSIACMKII